MCIGKNRLKRSPTHFCQNVCVTLTLVKSSPIVWATFVFSKNLAKVNNHPMGESGNPGLGEGMYL
jgi:hypothetical protein